MRGEIMLVDRIDHISFIAKDGDKITEAFTKLSGKKPMFIDDRTENLGIKQTSFIFPLGFYVQEVTDSSKPTAEWLKSIKQGAYAITLGCDSIKEFIPEMEARGFKKLSERVAPTEGVKFALFDTFDVLGFYVEFQQYIDMFDYVESDEHTVIVK
jgi:hypothetical protein